MKTKTKPQHTANGDIIDKTVFVDARNHIAKRYMHGHVEAIRFAEDMDRDAIIESLQMFCYDSREWHPYDEGTNSFTDTH